MIVTRLFPSGAFEISDIINGYRVHRTYYGYSKRDAMHLFRESTGRSGRGGVRVEPA